MTKTVIVRAWDKDDPDIYFEYEVSQEDYARSMIAGRLEKMAKKYSTILDNTVEVERS